MKAKILTLAILGATASGLFCVGAYAHTRAGIGDEKQALPEIKTPGNLAGNLPDALGIRWLEFDHDFGLMKEVAGPKTGRSRFVNEGTQTVSIVNVKPSCGCTNATFTGEPIEPGDTATITYTYDPTGRPGKFKKTVKVTLDNGMKYSIGISGNVLGTPESLDALYPIEAGALRLNWDMVNFGDVKMGSEPARFISSYNLSADTVSPVARCEVEGMKVGRNSKKAGPGDITTFGVYFDTKSYGKMGPFEIPIEILADESDPEAGRATVTAKGVILPGAMRLTAEQERKAAHAFMQPDPVDLGVIAAGREPEFTIAVLNEGKTPLEIQSVFDREGDVEITSLPKAIKPGKSGKIKGKLKAGTMATGPFRKTLTVISNDPRGGGVQETHLCGDKQ